MNPPSRGVLPPRHGSSDSSSCTRSVPAFGTRRSAPPSSHSRLRRLISSPSSPPTPTFTVGEPRTLGTAPRLADGYCERWVAHTPALFRPPISSKASSRNGVLPRRTCNRRRRLRSQRLPPARLFPQLNKHSIRSPNSQKPFAPWAGRLRTIPVLLPLPHLRSHRQLHRL